MYLGNFQSILPPYHRKQAECLQWLSQAHKLAENSELHSEDDFLKLFQSVGCSEKQIAERYFVLLDVQNTKMTLSKNVPMIVGAQIRDFTQRWIEGRRFNFANILKHGLFAVHPGGPQIFDQMMQHLELREEQVSSSRRLLKQRGTISSATLPHLWDQILNDPLNPSGTPIVSFAFGPGLTICGSLMEKL